MQHAQAIDSMDDVDDISTEDIMNIVATLPTRANAVVNPMPPARWDVGKSSEANTHSPCVCR